MSRVAADRPQWSVALVVFSGRTDLKSMRALKSGFRHCFVAVRTGTYWQVIEPMAHRLDIILLPDIAAADLALAYRRLGLRVVVALPSPVPRRPAPVRCLSCVEVIKRVLGLRLPLVFTPAQLHKALAKAQEKILDN